jgi:hypothetical protein
MLRLVVMSVLSGFLLAAAPQALAAPIVFTAQLTGDAERPTPIATSGNGSTIVTIDPDAHTLRVQITFADLNGITTASHIHAGIDPATQTAPVVTRTPSFPDFPEGVMSGSYDMTFDTLDPATYNSNFVNPLGSAEAAEAALLALMLAGEAYVNVHSTVAPSGEIRGNLVRVPEPAALALLLAAVGGLAAVRRRR